MIWHDLEACYLSHAREQISRKFWVIVLLSLLNNTVRLSMATLESTRQRRVFPRYYKTRMMVPYLKSSNTAFCHCKERYKVSIWHHLKQVSAWNARLDDAVASFSTFAKSSITWISTTLPLHLFTNKQQQPTIFSSRKKLCDIGCLSGQNAYDRESAKPNIKTYKPRSHFLFKVYMITTFFKTLHCTSKSHILLLKGKITNMATFYRYNLVEEQ